MPVYPIYNSTIRFI